VARMQAAELWCGRLLTRAVAVPAFRCGVFRFRKGELLNILLYYYSLKYASIWLAQAIRPGPHGGQQAGGPRSGFVRPTELLHQKITRDQLNCLDDLDFRRSLTMLILLSQRSLPSYLATNGLLP
jgi:hypothetical protein